MAINQRNEARRETSGRRKQRHHEAKEQQVRVNNSKSGSDYDRFKHVALLRRELHKKIQQSKRVLPQGRLNHINLQIRRIERCLMEKTREAA